jgi:hypothetical protein
MRCGVIALLFILLSTDLAFGQAASVPVPVFFPQLAMGGSADGQNYDTIIQIINHNSTSITGHVALFSDTGSPLAVSFDGQSPQSAADITLASGAARQIQLTLLATLPVAESGMYRPSITGLRITGTNRSGAQVSFQIDFTDFDSDIATTSSTSVSATAYIDFGSSVGFDFGSFTIDGTAIINAMTGTLSGTFQPPDITSTVPSGTPAVFYIVISDSSGNASNLIGIPVRF